MKHRLLEEKHDHYVVGDDKGSFRVAKFGLSDAMHQKIRGMASGGAVEGRYPEMPTPKDRRHISVKIGDVALSPAPHGAETADQHTARKKAEYEEETGDGYHVHGAKPPPQESMLARAGRAVGDFAKNALTSTAHAAPAAAAPPQASAPSKADPRRIYEPRGDDDMGDLEVQRAHGGHIPGYAYGTPDGGAGEYNPYDPMALPPRRDSGPVVYVAPQPVPGTVPVQLGGAGGGAPDTGAGGAGGSGGGPGWMGPGAVSRPDMGSGGASGGPSQNQTPPSEAQAMREAGPAGGAPSQLPEGVVPGRRPTTTDDAGPSSASPAVTRAARSAPADYGIADAQAAAAAESAAIKQRGGHEADLARENARIFGAQRQAMEAQAIEERRMRERAHTEAQHMAAQREALSEEMRKSDTRVDSGRYWASKSTGQKLLGIIGLALGAVGAGSDGVNRAAVMMGQAIDRDIEAQKAEHTLALQKGEQRARQLDSMYSQHHQLYQDDLAALAATKATALERFDNQLKQTASTYASPIAQANAAALSAQVQASAAKFKADATAKAEEGRHHRALEGIEAAQVAAKGAGLSNEEKGKVFDITTAASNIRRNLAKAKAIIGRSGTMELLGTDQTELESALGEVAQDWARMRDPGSTVKDAELANAKKQLGVSGGEIFTRNSTALKLLRDFEAGIDAREALGYQVRGLKPPQRPSK